MKDNSLHLWRSAVAKLLITVLVLVSVVIISPIAADAASKPSLTSKSLTILASEQYELQVNNEIAKSTYEWSSSNKKIATVDKKGIVTGVSKGVATITCKITTPKKNKYTLHCKVTVIKPAILFRINNKITALNVGQKYNLNRTLTPSTSNDRTTWKSSDITIASPDKRGKFVALKEGTVTITGTTISGASDSVTIKVVDKDGTVKNQSELDALLGSGAGLITIKTDEAVNLTIPSGDYSKQKLVVDAPNADITNYGKFALIEIRQIKANTWRENAIGNLLKILASKSNVIVGSGAKVSIEVSEEGATLTIVNNGIVEKIYVSKKASVNISGESDEQIPVTVDAPGITITSSEPLNLDCKAKIELILLPGAESTKVTAVTEQAIPVVKGDVTLKVTVGTGDSAKEETVKGTPITDSDSSGGSSGGGSGGNTNPTYATYQLAQSYTKLKSIDITYNGVTYSVTSTVLDLLKLYLSDEDKYLGVWKKIEKTSYGPFNGESVTITGTAGSATKTVSFKGGKLDGKSYTVTVNTNKSVTVSGAKLTFTVSKSGDKTLYITPIPTGLTFTPVF